MFEIDLKVNGRLIERVLVQNQGEKYRVMTYDHWTDLPNTGQPPLELAQEALDVLLRSKLREQGE